MSFISTNDGFCKKTVCCFCKYCILYQFTASRYFNYSNIRKVLYVIRIILCKKNVKFKTAIKNRYKIKTTNKLDNKIKHNLTTQIPNNTTPKNLLNNDNIKYTTFTYFGNITEGLTVKYSKTQSLKYLITQII